MDTLNSADGPIIIRIESPNNMDDSEIDDYLSYLYLEQKLKRLNEALTGKQKKPNKIMRPCKIHIEKIHLRNDKIQEAILYKDRPLLIKTDYLECNSQGRYINVLVKVDDPLVKVLQCIGQMLHHQITCKHICEGFCTFQLDPSRCRNYDCNKKELRERQRHTNCFMRFIIGFGGIYRLTSSEMDMTPPIRDHQYGVKMYANQSQLAGNYDQTLYDPQDWFECKFE